MTVIEIIDQECENIKGLLIEKNKKYGNSFQRPLNVFSKLGPLEGVRVRLDDKLNRLYCGQGDDEDTKLDLLGYLILERVLMRMERESI